MLPIVARALVIAITLFGPARIGMAEAGMLDHGNWSPSGCGAAPVAPSGLNLSSTAAYNDSMKWIKTYQDDYNKFSDCMVKEANEDHDGINDYVRASQDKARQFFDKVNADSKHAHRRCRATPPSAMAREAEVAAVRSRRVNRPQERRPLWPISRTRSIGMRGPGDLTVAHLSVAL